jgi:hypothetical protein
MKKKRMLLSLVLVMLLNGCGYIVEGPNTQPSETPTTVFTNTAIPTSTHTLEPTSTPTQTPKDTPTPSPTPTLVPTPAFTSVENDLSPSFAQSISIEYMGVKFNLELITDSSLAPAITKIRLEDGFEHTLAAVVAVDMFELWWAKGPVPHNFDPHTIDLSELREEFASFMSLWAKAQETNNPEDWGKVQIDRILANDLNDGNGYQMNYHNFWMMYDGETPAGITGVKTFSIAFVYTTGVNNIQVAWTSSYSGEFIKGYGMNLDNDKLIVYLGDTDFRLAGDVPWGCGVSCIPAQLVLNFIPMALKSSVTTGYKRFPNDEDRLFVFDLRDHLFVTPKEYP